MRKLRILFAAAALASAVLTGAAGLHAATFIVLYRDNATPANAAAGIAQAGGTVVYNYSQIGVVIARSDDPAFRAFLIAGAK